MDDYTIDGFKNEHNICKYLNGNKVKFLIPSFQEMIYKLYGDIDKNSNISAHVDIDKKKFDIVISINDIIKRISIKKGINNSVHVEGISSFIHFLIDSGVERDAVIEYLKYHYADGTQNGTGSNRMSVSEYKEINQDKIDYVNEKINTPYILRRAIRRFVLQGKNSNILIDGIIYGVKNDFLFTTSDEIEEILMSKIDVYSTGIHFGNLYCQPQTRNLNYNPKYEKKRFCVQIKWYSIFDDIMEYMNNNVIKGKR